MSTVDKATADKVVNGEYDSDGWKAIIKYNNQFDGGEAYKLCRTGEEFRRGMNSPAMRNPVLYWVKDGAF
jgi:hypothetical protein